MHFSVTCIRNDEKYDMHHQALLIFNKKMLIKVMVMMIFIICFIYCAVAVG